MVASFIVPGTVTLREVSRPAKDETPAQRLYRLAQKAVIEGCRVIRTYGTGHFLVTSGSDPGTAYTVDRGIRTCDCPGFATHQVCKHIAMVLAELGELPDPNPEPPAPVAAVALPESTDTAWVEIVCECCAGSGVDAMKDRNGDWRDVTCPICDGRGKKDIQVAVVDLPHLDHYDLNQLRGVQCGICHGAGYERMSTGGRLSDWIPTPCKDCQGAGLVPIPAALPEVVAA